jgi:hypothetical protein
MITSSSGFISSNIAVGQNAVKSILFRCAAVLLQIAVYKSFSLLAFRYEAFTSYLMFAEDPIQKALFVTSRGFTRHGILVLCLAVLLAGAGLYDTLLWGLDAPGYVAQKTNVTASTIANRLLEDPGYLVFSSTVPGTIAPLDKHIAETLGANLFQAGVNFTLTGELDPGNRKVVRATNSSRRPVPGPRIWLDDQGFSVSPDTYVTYANSPDGDISKTMSCPWHMVGANSMHWDCVFNNSYALAFVRDEILGRPEIHWDDETDAQYMSQYLRTNREDNPWTSLGTGGDTALMKQMFTITKGRQRHAFIETAWKASMVFDYAKPLPLDDIEDLVKRSWSLNAREQQNPVIPKIVQKISAAREKNCSYMFGGNSGTDTSVRQYNYELLSPEVLPGMVDYSLLRISLVNITLVRSDTLAQPVIPFEPCNFFYQNEATGGRVRGTDCYKSMGGNQTNHRFLGQVDTSAVLILNGLLGDGQFNISEKALNQAGFEWFLRNDDKLNNLLLSRGFIMALDPGFVTVEVSNVKVAISYLQITLIVLTVLLAAVSWLCLSTFATDHYSSSLLSNLFATTNVDGTNTSRKPGYLSKVPEIRLSEEGSGIVMETLEPAGVFRHDSGMGMGKGAAYTGGSSEEEIREKRQTCVSQQVVIPTTPANPTDRDPFLSRTTELPTC